MTPRDARIPAATLGLTAAQFDDLQEMGAEAIAVKRARIRELRQMARALQLGRVIDDLPVGEHGRRLLVAEADDDAQRVKRWASLLRLAETAREDL